MGGLEFITHLVSGQQNMIVADLKVFPSLNVVRKIKNYKDFMESSCSLSLLVIDSVQVIAIAKDDQLISDFTNRAKQLGNTKIELVNNVDLKGLLNSVWEEEVSA